MKNFWNKFSRCKRKSSEVILEEGNNKENFRKKGFFEGISK